MSTIETWSGADTGWERPGPTAAERRNDLWLALAAALTAALGAETMRSLGAFENEPHGVPWQYLGMLTAAALVPLRRSRPTLVVIAAGVHMLVLGLVLPMTMSTLPMQALYFFLIFSGVAWGRDRRAVVAAVGLVLALMVGWVAWSYAFGSGVAQATARFSADLPDQVGLFDVPLAFGLLMLLNNVLFFGGSILLGQIAWNAARRTGQVVEQARTIEAQSGRLRDQAVVAERIRIARELHDVVAHHVSVMGVQAGAARKVMDRDPDAARTALTAIERNSRDAVGQMHGLLGTLRAEEPDEEGMPSVPATGAGAVVDRAPQPTLQDLPALAAGATTPTCRVQVRVVESAPGAAARVPTPVQLSAYRIVQEAVANVHRHSTARGAQAVVRVDEDEGRLEVEVVDDGSLRPGTAGTGLGLRGMRERAQHLGGGVEAGPRQGMPGWRVRVWFPLEGRRAGVAPAAGAGLSA
ncbi:sensor histidine kinase [Ornithinimicrobium avium]|uniref:histidine kinase n=1 Tax=Ornithinimicrobium avium TaxID=2283195 RepID=A0A345NPN5_9MICO|nr:sensor histidine kinase [Ornithinimicrobium avium]AXH96993.1 sensor histidine kinase [Ornithinimicrobium avium]